MRMDALLHSDHLPFLLVVFATTLCCAGCCHNPAPTVRQTEAGLVYLLPGIEGGPWSLQWARKAFCDAGVESEMRSYSWKRPFGTLDNLTDYEGNRARAAALADEIAIYRQQHAAGAIDIVGYSGGGGLAIMVAEALPEQVRLRNIVLVQAALSPDYNLTPALAHVAGKLVNFYCPTDWLILGVGTKLFGTMDRAKTTSAGKDGFDLKCAVPDPDVRIRVEQHRWKPEMLLTGHVGNHASILLYSWNKRYVAPYLLTPK